jgi:hypothetical protein
MRVENAAPQQQEDPADAAPTSEDKDKENEAVKEK